MSSPETRIIRGEGRTAFITGANGGIGRACVDLMSACGANIVGVDRKIDECEDAGSLMLETDVCVEAQVESALTRGHEKFGRIDYIIHTAGIVGRGPIHDVSLDDWRHVVDTNLTASFLVLKHGISRVTKPGGAFVLFGSSNGSNGGSHLSGPAYAAAKGALLSLNRYCAKEWASKGVRINIISPGPTDTPMLDRLTDNEHEALKASLPLRDYATPQQCAAAAIFLCSEHAASVTGTNYNISSGLVLD